MRTKEIEKIVKRDAVWYYDTDGETAIKMLTNDFGKGSEHGYAIFGYASDIGEFEHIERLGEISEVYDTDIEAARQAAKDGIKLIPYSEQPKKEPYRHYRFLDTPLNRHRLSKV